MEVNFFKNVGKLDIGGGKFVVNNGPNNSRKEIVHNHSTTVNDRSQHTTNYGGYTNYGQHAEGKGQINNYGSVTTNHGPVYGHRQWPPRLPMIDQSPSPSDDDNSTDYWQPPPPEQNSWYVRPDRFVPGNKDYPAAMQSNPTLGNQKAKPSGLPRAKSERPTRPTKEFDQTTTEFQREYETMSPKMKEYLQTLGYFHDPQDSLSKSMANVSLDDSGPQLSRSPGNYGRRTPEAAARNVPQHPSYDSDEEDDVDEPDPESTSVDSQKYAFSYTRNDNRVITNNVNSHNTNTENVVDSYNDNSTRTDIRKNPARA